MPKQTKRTTLQVAYNTFKQRPVAIWHWYEISYDLLVTMLRRPSLTFIATFIHRSHGRSHGHVAAPQMVLSGSAAPHPSWTSISHSNTPAAGFTSRGPTGHEISWIFNGYLKQTLSTRIGEMTELATGMALRCQNNQNRLKWEWHSMQCQHRTKCQCISSCLGAGCGWIWIKSVEIPLPQFLLVHILHNISWLAREK